MPGAIDTLLNQFLDMGIPAFDCLVYYRGNEVYRRLAGFRDAERNTPLDAGQWFNIYSVSKLMTVTAVMQLIEEGTLHLQDRLSDFFPEFAHMQVREGDTVRSAETSITLEHLLTMTAGFNYDRSATRPIWVKAREMSGGDCPTVQTVRLLAQEPLDFEPGTDWQYSFAHDILAGILEVIAGERFSLYMEKHLFEPLGMMHSTFDAAQVPDELLCAQYRYEAQTHTMANCGKSIQNGFQLGDAYEAGGAGCRSTAEDVMRLLESLRTGEILTPATVKHMSENRLHGRPADTFRADQHDTRYGYGLGIGCPNGTTGWDSFGWGGAAGAFCAVDLSHEISIVYLQHVLARPNRWERRELCSAVRKDLGIL